MSEKEQLLELYEEFSQTGWMSTNGLCNEINLRRILKKSSQNLSYFHPSNEDLEELDKKGCFLGFWGCEDKLRDYKASDKTPYKAFTTFRQTILAFLIAMAED